MTVTRVCGGDERPPSSATAAATSHNCNRRCKPRTQELPQPLTGVALASKEERAASHRRELVVERQQRREIVGRCVGVACTAVDSRATLGEVARHAQAVGQASEAQFKPSAALHPRHAGAPQLPAPVPVEKPVGAGVSMNSMCANAVQLPMLRVSLRSVTFRTPAGPAMASNTKGPTCWKAATPTDEQPGPLRGRGSGRARAARRVHAGQRAAEGQPQQAAVPQGTLAAPFCSPQVLVLVGGCARMHGGHARRPAPDVRSPLQPQNEAVIDGCGRFAGVEVVKHLPGRVFREGQVAARGEPGSRGTGRSRTQRRRAARHIRQRCGRAAGASGRLPAALEARSPGQGPKAEHPHMATWRPPSSPRIELCDVERPIRLLRQSVHQVSRRPLDCCCPP